jgi:hypothetical protein
MRHRQRQDRACQRRKRFFATDRQPSELSRSRPRTARARRLARLATDRPRSAPRAGAATASRPSISSTRIAASTPAISGVSPEPPDAARHYYGIGRCRSEQADARLEPDGYRPHRAGKGFAADPGRSAKISICGSLAQPTIRRAERPTLGEGSLPTTPAGPQVSPH